MATVIIDGTRCDDCGMCADVCPPALIRRGEDGKPSRLEDHDRLCMSCGHCAAICPRDAVSVDGVNTHESIDRKLLPGAAQVDHFLKSRRSTRAFKQDPVPREVLERIIDSARYAPSAHNSQPVRWLVFEDPAETRRVAELMVGWMRSTIKDDSKVAAALHCDFMVGLWERGINRITHGAPHLVIAHASRKVFIAQQSVTIALAYLDLAAYSRGLGTCWAGLVHALANSYPPLIELLALPEGHECYGAMLLGYPRYRYSHIPPRKEVRISWR